MSIGRDILTGKSDKLGEKIIREKSNKQDFTNRLLPLGLLKIATRPSSAASQSLPSRIPSCVCLDNHFRDRTKLKQFLLPDALCWRTKNQPTK